MVGRQSSPLLPKKKTALKGRGSARPKKAPAYEEDEEIPDRPVRQPKAKKPPKRRGVEPSAPQQQLSTEDKKQIRRRRQRRSTILRILVVTLVVALAVVVWLNWNVLAPDKVWARFQDLVGGGSGSYPVDLSGSDARRVVQVDNYTVVLTDSHLTYFNASGAEVSRYGCTYAEPLVRTADKYVLVAEQGARRLQLSTRSKVEWEKEIEYPIRSVALNKKGQLAVLTDGPQGYTVQIAVYDKGGKLLYTRNSNRTVTDVALAPDGTTVSTLSVEAVNGTLNTRLEVFALASSAPDAQAAYTVKDALMYRAAYLDDGTLMAVGEQSVVMMNTSDGGVFEFIPDGQHVLGYAVGGDTVALALRAYGDTTGGEAVVISAVGTRLSSWRFDGEFRHVSGFDGRYALLTDTHAHGFTSSGVTCSAAVQADGRQAVFAEDRLVVMGLNRLEAFPVD